MKFSPKTKMRGGGIVPGNFTFLGYLHCKLFFNIAMISFK
jgi:hypothetical protein